MRKTFNKLFIILIVIVVVICSITACDSTRDLSDAEKYKVAIIPSFGDEIYSNLVDVSGTYANRTAGSTSSETFIDYIKNYMTGLGYTTAEQSFTVTLTDSDIVSKNIICSLPSVENSKGTIILGCYYDNCYESYSTESKVVDGAYESGAAIATVMALSNYLKAATLEYDLKIVYFGAGVQNWFGANYYLNKLSSSEKSNIKLMVNYSMLGGGDNLYMYSRDKATNYNEVFYDASLVNNLDFTEIPLNKRVVDSQLSEDAVLSYSHIGMFGNNYIFMNEQIPSVSYMAINWEDDELPFYVEIEGEENVYETDKDTLENMQKRMGVDNIKKQLNAVAQSTVVCIVDNQEYLLKELENPDEIAAWTQGTAAYYISTVAVKILALGVMFIFLIMFRNYIKKNQDKYKSVIPKVEIKVDSTNPQDIFSNVDFGDKPKDSGNDSNDQNKNGNNVGPDDVFE